MHIRGPMPYDCDVLILGGSFTGIELVRRLARDRVGRTLRITVVDRQREHLYIPLGHELLSEQLRFGVEAGTVLASARYVEGVEGFANANSKATWVQGELVGFEPSTRTATLADGKTLSGRFVVFALGSEIRAPAALMGGERLLGYKSEAEFERTRELLSSLWAPGS